MKPLLVVKYGTACLTNEAGEIELNVIKNITEQLSALHKKYRLVLVSSGAVGAGKSSIKNYTGTVSQKKAAAAIGNPILIETYASFLRKKNIAVGQILCERQHFSDRAKFIQLKSTLETMWENNVIPISNENDVMSGLDLKFSDNDQLAMMLAINFSAKTVMFGTSAPGLWDEKKQVIPTIEHFDARIYGLVRPEETSHSGLGGMVSKLTYADMATQYGVNAIIFAGRAKAGIIAALDKKIGTLCLAQGCRVPARKRWMAVSSLSLGRIGVDDGAKKALLKRKSLLSVGAKKME
jgi:glutamate 5-kinase